MSFSDLGEGAGQEGKFMDDKKLEYIQKIMETQSITEAARQLYISQPALSKTISSLEREYGTSLFEKRQGRISLTLAGQAIVGAAEKQRDIRLDLERELIDIKSLKTGMIRLGISPGRTLHFLPVLLPGFQKKYPKMQLVVNTQSRLGYENLVADGELDLAFVMDSAEVDAEKKAQLVYEPLFSYYCLLAAPPNHPVAAMAGGILDWRKRAPIDLTLVKDEPFISVIESKRHSRWNNAIYETYGFTPYNAVLLSDEAAVFSLVQAGVGFALTQDHFAFAQKRGVFFRLDRGGFETTLCAIYRRDSYLTRAMRDFIDLVKYHTALGTWESLDS